MDKQAWKVSQEAQKAARTEVKNLRYLAAPVTRAELVAVVQENAGHITRSHAGLAVLVGMLEAKGVLEKGEWLSEVQRVMTGAPDGPPADPKKLVEVV